MSDPIISIRGLSKRYELGRDQSAAGGYVSLREVIADNVSKGARAAADVLRGRSLPRAGGEGFWALKDIDLDIQEGETIGVIGRNGAGKSTLLKVLSRITEPTEGRIELRGRVASLLEVGTGFHPELTGRENIFLNGAVLGMTQVEVRRKFDEIVAFAEVEQFLDTPVKRYSSGMYVRLAFSVAAHLDPDILVVDEVLAVGDVAFQKKCLGKMDEVSRKAGRTVLFVSHSIAAVSALTQRAILLSKGRLVGVGPTEDVVMQYMETHERGKIYETPQQTAAPHIARIELMTSEGPGLHQFDDPLEVRVLVRHDTPMRKACLSLQLVDQYNRAVVHTHAYHDALAFGARPGFTQLTCRFPALKLNVGYYQLNANLSEPPGGEVYARVKEVCGFEVIRTRDATLWGWHADVCTHFEDCAWSVTAADQSEASELARSL